MNAARIVSILVVVAATSCNAPPPPAVEPPAAPPPTAPPPSAGFAITEEQMKILEVLVADDLKGIDRGADTMAAQSGLIVTTTPAELVKKYRENELAADAQFAGKKVVIIGKIRAVKKDAFGAPFIALQGPGLLEDVLARVPEQSNALLLKLKAGAPISLMCTVRGERITVVVLADCKLPEQYQPEVSNLVFDRIRSVASLKVAAKDDVASTMMLMLSYAEILLRKDDPNCVNSVKGIQICIVGLPETRTAKYTPLAFKELASAGLDMKGALPGFQAFK